MTNIYIWFIRGIFPDRVCFAAVRVKRPRIWLHHIRLYILKGWCKCTESLIFAWFIYYWHGRASARYIRGPLYIACNLCVSSKSSCRDGRWRFPHDSCITMARNNRPSRNELLIIISETPRRCRNVIAILLIMYVGNAWNYRYVITYV